MSFILKALKKLEEEKAARQSEPAEIGNAILTPDKRSYSEARAPVYRMVLIPLVFVAGVGMTYFFTHGTAPPGGQTGGTDARLDPPSQSAPASPALPTDRAEPNGTRIAPPDNALVERTPSRQTAREDAPAGPPPNKSTTAPSLPEHQVSLDAAAPSLTVKGIALQDDPAESMAVVNGVLVKIGMTIGGVQVVGIFQDKVRFKGNGATFEVQMTK
jgi:general secretion pathway protein B